MRANLITETETSVTSATQLSRTEAQAGKPCDRFRFTIRPVAILEVVRRKGRKWGLSAQYEESRLGVQQRMHRP